MKRSKDANDLASRLTAAATAPLQVLSSPEATEQPLAAEAPPAPSPTRSQKVKLKAKPETLGINLRPPRELYERYVSLAADRSKQTGRTVSAQQIMLEVLERGRA